MRIISGKFKGLILDGFTIDGTRPTMDRVKESLFAMLGQTVIDSVCLDLFAGSGNLGLEAISNGASEVYFVDHNKIAIETIKKNMNKAKLNSFNFVYKMDYLEALQYFKKQNKKFDIIFLDPPYQKNLLNTCIEKIEEFDLLNEDGIIVLEYENYDVNYRDFTSYKKRSYGSKIVEFIKNVK